MENQKHTSELSPCVSNKEPNFKIVLNAIHRHSNLGSDRINPNAIMFAYGDSEEIEAMIDGIEETLGIQFDTEEYDICQIGEMKVSRFIDYVEQMTRKK